MIKPQCVLDPEAVGSTSVIQPTSENTKRSRCADFTPSVLARKRQETSECEVGSLIIGCTRAEATDTAQ